jgi:dihydroxy-acid dehydratase
MTRKAFENAITVVIALGGSTNAVLHLLAMADTAGVDLTWTISPHRRKVCPCWPT